MWTIITWLLGKTGVVDKVLDVFKSKGENEKQIILSQIASNQEDNKLRSQLGPAFPFLVYFIVLPYAVHSGLIVLDSCIPDYWGHIGVPALPQPYAGYEREFLLFFIVSQPISSAIKGVTSWLHK